MIPSAQPSPPPAGQVRVYMDPSTSLLSTVDEHGVVRTTTPSSTGALPSNGIQYVSPSGSDSNDGRSWATAKFSINAAFDAMPTTGGVMYITDNGTAVTAAAAGDPSGCGIWLIGPGDVNYASPPAGFRKVKPVKFIGVPTAGGSQSNTHTGAACEVTAGSQSDRTKPAIWITGVGSQVYFEGLSLRSARPIVVGEDSSHGRTNAGGASGIMFRNCQAGVSQANVSGVGPTVDICGNTFWIFFYDCTLNNAVGYFGTDPYTNDNAACVLLDGANANGVGLIFVQDCNFDGGGIKHVPGANPGFFTFTNITIEGNFTSQIAPCIWMSGSGTANGTQVTAFGIATADSGNQPSCQIDGGPAENFTAIACNGTSGPCVNLGSGGNNLTPTLFNISPMRQGQNGFFKGHIVGQHDSARRAFGPSVCRFGSLCSQLPANWGTTQFQGVTTVTTGLPAPDGTNNAAQAANTGAGQEQWNFFNSNVTVAVGDFLIVGGWFRNPNGGGYSGSPTRALNLGVGGAGNVATQVYNYAPNPGDGEWQWQYSIVKMTTVGTASAPIQFVTYFSSAVTMQAFAPVFIHIPSGTVSDNEAFEIAVNLQQFCDVAVAGDVSMLRGQRLIVPRIKANLGTAYSGADAAIVPSSGFGSTAVVSAARGFDQAFSFSVTANGSGLAANPTIAITFKDGTWTTAPQYQVQRNDLATPFNSPPHTWSESATVLTITFNGTPSAGVTYSFKCLAMGN